MQRKYYYTVEVTKAAGVQSGYVNASSLKDAERKYQEGDHLVTAEELEVLEIAEDVKWVDEDES